MNWISLLSNNGGRCDYCEENMCLFLLIKWIQEHREPGWVLGKKLFLTPCCQHHDSYPRQGTSSDNLKDNGGLPWPSGTPASPPCPQGSQRGRGQSSDRLLRPPAPPPSTAQSRQWWAWSLLWISHWIKLVISLVVQANITSWRKVFFWVLTLWLVGNTMWNVSVYFT